MDREQIEWDPLLKKIWGYSKTEKPNQEGFWKGVYPEDRQSVQEALNRASDPNGNGHYTSRYRVKNMKNGKVSWVQASGQVQFEGDKPQKMIGMIQNITEFKKLEISLQEAIEELKEVNTRKNDFLAILGHELRNPLAAISGGVDFIRLGEENQEQITEMLGQM